jgi:aryl-alcohol dehydrogenase-like predicted oxidoreductase
MDYRQLGRSGLMVSELCLGTQLFDERTARATPPDDANRILSIYADAGGNFIDTADVYADGRSEKVIGKWLEGRVRHNVIIATKVRFPRGTAPNETGLSRAHIMTEVENSLLRLGTDYIDLFYAHMWDGLTPIEETMRAFDDLVSAGRVRYIGVSNFTAWQVMKALAVSEVKDYVRFVAAQYQYSLLVRDIEREFIPLCESEGLGLLPWSPLGGGFLTGKYRRDVPPSEGRLSTASDDAEEAWDRHNTSLKWAIIDKVEEVAREQEKTFAQVALAWLLEQLTVCSIVIGPRTVEQLEDNLGAVGWRLTADELSALNTVSALPENYPYRFQEVYGGDRR